MVSSSRPWGLELIRHVVIRTAGTRLSPSKPTELPELWTRLVGATSLWPRSARKLRPSNNSTILFQYWVQLYWSNPCSHSSPLTCLFMWWVCQGADSVAVLHGRTVKSTSNLCIWHIFSPNSTNEGYYATKIQFPFTEFVYVTTWNVSAERNCKKKYKAVPLSLVVRQTVPRRVVMQSEMFKTKT